MKRLLLAITIAAFSSFSPAHAATTQFSDTAVRLNLAVTSPLLPTSSVAYPRIGDSFCYRGDSRLNTCRTGREQDVSSSASGLDMDTRVWSSLELTDTPGWRWATSARAGGATGWLSWFNQSPIAQVISWTVNYSASLSSSLPADPSPRNISIARINVSGCLAISTQQNTSGSVECSVTLAPGARFRLSAGTSVTASVNVTEGQVPTVPVPAGLPLLLTAFGFFHLLRNGQLSGRRSSIA